MQPDKRGFRIAVLANEVVNRRALGFDVLQVLERAGWGAILLPPSWYPDEVASELLTQFAEDVEEFVRHGYELVCVGSCDALAGPLSKLGVPMPRSIVPAGEADLDVFLSAWDTSRPASPRALPE